MNRSQFTASLLICTFVAMRALADIPPPDTQECTGQDAGARCGPLKKCEPSTCFRNDYTGGVPPKRKAFGCLKCVEAAPDAGR